MLISAPSPEIWDFSRLFIDHLVVQCTVLRSQFMCLKRLKRNENCCEKFWGKSNWYML